MPVRVVLDPFNRVAESNETNNEATASLTIRTRPDLFQRNTPLSDDEPVAGETVQPGTAQSRADRPPVDGGVYDGNPARAAR